MVGENKITVFNKSLYLLCVHQFWPKRNEVFSSKKCFYIRCFLMVVSTIWLFFAGFARIVVSIYLNLDNDLAENISMTMSLIGQIYVALLFVKNQKIFQDIFLRLSDTSVFGKPPEFESGNKKLDQYSRLWYYFVTFGQIYYFIYNSILSKGLCEERNKEKERYETCGLYTQIYLPFEFDYFPVKEIITVLEAWANFMIGRACAVIQFMCYEAAEQISIRFRHLEANIHDTFKDGNEASKRKKFQRCVEYHISIIRLSEDVSKCFETIMFFNVLVGGIVLGSLGYATIASFNTAALAHFAAWFMCLYLVCLGGQTLIDSSVHVAVAAFEAQWQDADPKLVKDLQFLIFRAQKPLYMRFGMFGFLKLELFVAIVKTSYSYLMLLQRALL